MSDRLNRIKDLVALLSYATNLDKPAIHDIALEDLKTEIAAYEQETRQ